MQPPDLSFGRLFESVRDAVVVVDTATGRIVLWNPAAETVLGYSAAEARRLPLAELVPERLRAHYRAVAARFLSGDPGPIARATNPLELTALRQDGAEVTIELTLSWIDGPERGHLLAILRDVTRRRRVEEALREAEEKYRNIVDNAVEGIYQTTPGGRLIMANPALVRICGYDSPAEMIEALTDVDRQVYVEPNRRSHFMRRLEEADAIFDFESEIYRKDGSTIWISENARGVRDGRGTLLYYEGTVVDISDRKRAEAERRRFIREQAARLEAEAIQQRYAFLAEASALLAASLDVEVTLTNLAKLVTANLADWCIVDLVADDHVIRRVTAVHRDPERESIVRALLDHYPLDPDSEHPIAKVLRSGRTEFIPEVPPETLAAIAVDADHLRLLRELDARSFLAAPLAARGRILGVLSFARTGVSPRYRRIDLAVAEDLARRTALAVDNARLYQEATRAVEERDEFISVAAHELKTPMTSLRGTAQFMLRRLDRQETLPPDTARQAFHLIDQQTDRLARLVSQLMDTVRIQSGRLVLDREEVDLVDLVKGVVATAQIRTDRHTLIVRGLPSVRVSVDALRIEQVITNLLDNAIKFSPRGGTIEVELTCPDPAQVRLAVRDEGVGIALEHRGHIFDRFYQAHRESHESGMGLGLYISRQIVELHHGQMAVEFPPEGGTRFVVRLPTLGQRAAASNEQLSDGLNV